ncbi:MAG TPA: NUDIX hydrolase [Micromonosporaceae bacterium]|nr:NUDIX hydrolase [Micromonosporaceae bacterium]HCU51543.1 NUDIX hydrolase [Micromonosporaceae bacterium]
MAPIEQRLKVGAYAVCLREDQILLAHYVSPHGSQRHWTLPGGKVEHGEDPFDAVVREVAEETGYQVEVERLLGVDSRTQHVDWGIPGGAELHSIGIFYRVRVVGGELRNEIRGSTDLADWIAIAEVPGLERACIIDIAIELERFLPLSGHTNPVPVNGLLRH